MDETFYMGEQPPRPRIFNCKFEYVLQCLQMYYELRAFEHFTHWLNRLSSDDLLKLHHHIYAVHFQCHVVQTIHQVHVITIDNRMLVICRMENETNNESSIVLNQLINMMNDGFV